MDTQRKQTASEMLRKWLRDEGRKAGWVADQLSVNAATVSRWMNDHKAPHKWHREKLDNLTNGAVPAGAWE